MIKMLRKEVIPFCEIGKSDTTNIIPRRTVKKTRAI